MSSLGTFQEKLKESILYDSQICIAEHDSYIRLVYLFDAAKINLIGEQKRTIKKLFDRIFEICSQMTILLHRRTPTGYLLTSLDQL